MKRLYRWLFEPTQQPFTPGFLALAALLGTAGYVAGFWVAWSALEQGKGHILAGILVLLVLGWADLARRLWRRSR